MNRLLITLACSLAFAAGNSLANDTAKDHAQKATKSAEASADSVGDKMKRGAHKMGGKMRHLGHKAEDKVGKAHGDDRRTAQEAGADTRAMGSSGTSMSGGDRARQERMDQAYNDYKAKSGTSSSTSR